MRPINLNIDPVLCVCACVCLCLMLHVINIHVQMHLMQYTRLFWLTEKASPDLRICGVGGCNYAETEHPL